MSFGLRSWNGRRGLLYLAPPYIHGGQMGDHVVFQWRQGRTTYAISLHSWWPLPQAAATLQAMVMALP